MFDSRTLIYPNINQLTFSITIFSVCKSSKAQHMFVVESIVFSNDVGVKIRQHRVDEIWIFLLS